jgi:hypothetical protein
MGYLDSLITSHPWSTSENAQNANFALTQFSEGCLAGVLGSSLEGYDTATLVAYTGSIPGSMLQSSRGERTLPEGAGPLPEEMHGEHVSN